jgi:hypothetical protein
MEAALHVWFNVATVLVLAGAVTYATLIPYMTRGDE